MQGKVLLLAQRRIAGLVVYCLSCEFEDTVAAGAGAERIDASDLPGGRILEDLNSDPERLRAVRRNSVLEASHRHTGCPEFRWCLMCSGLAPTEGIRACAKHLGQMASQT